jgi:tRNA (guanine-N7-)-methyltransferase
MRVRTHTNPFNFFERLKKLDLKSVFNKSCQPLDFEIGFGRGVFLREWASNNPKRNIIGVEVRKQIVKDLEIHVDKLELTNTHLIYGNAEIVLEDCIEDNSIENCFLFHPDPWFKKKHHKRRVINNDFLNILKSKIKPKGKLYISTDVELLHTYMEAHMSQLSSFKKLKNDIFWEEFYKSHWSEFSINTERKIYKSTYIKE